MQRFKAKLEPVPHGGHFVTLPEEVALAAGLRRGSRVRGTFNGVFFRSSTPKYSGAFHLGIHTATVAAADVKPGDTVTIELQIDSEPLAGDVVPPDLLAALRKTAGAVAAWKALAPSHRREHVNAILEAKKPETRERRIQNAIRMLTESRRPAKKR